LFFELFGALGYDGSEKLVFCPVLFAAPRNSENQKTLRQIFT
jgi:hypothetical protein